MYYLYAYHHGISLQFTTLISICSDDVQLTQTFLLCYSNLLTGQLINSCN